jgi:coenzyme F420-reducing hydrogenase beta subunit
MDHRGQYVPQIDLAISQISLGDASLACPFSRQVSNESDIAEQIYGAQLHHSDILGFYRNTYAGYNDNTREFGSSGGIISWLLLKLLELDYVDYGMTVGQTGHADPRFEYVIVSDRDAIFNCAGSAYYPVNMASAIAQVKEQPGRYAFVGLPCFNKALRLLRQKHSTLDERIAYQIGLVCGHLKTSHYLDYIQRRVKLSPETVTGVRFRKNNPQSNAGNYNMELTAIVEGKVITRTVDNRSLGDNWGMGLFKPNACDFCDDIYAETADFVVMDAWLPEYIDDYRGTSLIITRNGELDKFILDGIDCGEITGGQIDPSLVIQSQKGAIRHRRRGLGQRLHFVKSKKWIPLKRVQPTNDGDYTFRIMQRMRCYISVLNNRIYRLQKRIPGLMIYKILMWPIRFLYRLIRKWHYKYGDNERYHESLNSRKPVDVNNGEGNRPWTCGRKSSRGRFS